jgi:hypothetical protein
MLATMASVLQRLGTGSAPVGALLHVLILALILGVICYILFWAMGALGVPEPIKRVVTVLVVVIVAIWLLMALLPLLGVGV